MRESSFTWGAEHPFLERLVTEYQRTFEPDVRVKLDLTSVRWMFDNVFCQVGLYVIDGAWAVDPRVQPWLEHVRRGDVRSVMNGMEWAQPR